MDLKELWAKKMRDEGKILDAPEVSTAHLHHRCAVLRVLSSCFAGEERLVIGLRGIAITACEWDADRRGASETEQAAQT